MDVPPSTPRSRQLAFKAEPELEAEIRGLMVRLRMRSTTEAIRHLLWKGIDASRKEGADGK